MVRKPLKWNILNYLLRLGIIPNRPNRIFPRDLIEQSISYLFGLVQRSTSLDSTRLKGQCHAICDLFYI